MDAVLEGYQAILKPSQSGYSLKALVSETAIKALIPERTECLEWAKTKASNPRRAKVNAEPWEKVAPDQYLLKFSWESEKDPVVVVNVDGSVAREDLPLFSGSLVKLAFYQKPYLRPDNSIGTCLVLQAVQAIKAVSCAGVDVGSPEMTVERARELFGVA